MEYRFLGRTGVRVSALSLGTMTFGGTGSRFFEAVGGVDQRDAERMLDLALEHGINLVDTADVYSRGVSEEMLGRALHGRRSRVLVATKCHGRMSADVNDVGQSRHHIIASCHASLRRLGIDHIDLYQVHGFDAWTAWDECLEALTDLRRQGKINYLGCSNLAGWQVMKALGIAAAAGLARFACLQGNYSLVARDAELELLPLCVDQSLGFIVWSPLAGGFLTGKYQSGAEDAGRRGAVGDPGTINETTGHQVLCAFRRIAQQRGVPLAQVALNYLLRKRGVTSVLVGARTVAQFTENLGCLAWTLSDGEMADLDRASAVPLPYPYWHQRQYNSDRSSRADLL